MTLPTNFDRW